MISRDGRIVLRPGECMFDGERWLVAVRPCDCSICALRGEECVLINCIPFDGLGYHLVEANVTDYFKQINKEIKK